MSHEPATDRPPIYGMIAQFSTPEDLMVAAAKARDAGYREIDAYSSFPIEGMMEALGKKRTKLPAAILLCGFLGTCTGLGLQAWTAASNAGFNLGPYIVAGYPMNIGGRPMLSIPNFIPVTFELTVLFAAFCAFFGTIILNRLPMPYHPLFNSERFSMASVDKFFLGIEARDPQFDQSATGAFLESLAPEAVEVVEH